MKNYNKTKPMHIEEFAAEKAWWNNRVENEHAWKISADDIKARNYNLDIKNPHSPDAVIHDPEELLADYATLQQRIAGTRDHLKAVLAAALEGKRERDVERAPVVAGDCAGWHPETAWAYSRTGRARQARIHHPDRRCTESGLTDMNLNASDYVVFVDESGDHSLESINPEWPLFVLSFCIFPVDKYVQEVTQAIRSLKFDFFGHDLVSLHEHDIRKKKGAFSQLNEEARDDFLNHLSMQFGLERLADFLAINGQQGRETRVICEARGAKKDPDPLPLLSCIKCCPKKTA